MFDNFEYVVLFFIFVFLVYKKFIFAIKTSGIHLEIINDPFMLSLKISLKIGYYK